MKQGALLLGDAVWIGSVRKASSLVQRLRGLLGYRTLAPGEGLLIEPCGAVHTVGMRFTLDVIFLDSEWRVVTCVQRVRPGRLWVSGGLRSRRVVEVATGWLDLGGATPGTPVRWVTGETGGGGGACGRG